MRETNRHFPAIAAGKRGAGEYTVIEGEPSVMFPAGDMNGIMSCTEASHALSYGMLAIADQYGFDLNYGAVYKATGLRPEWYRTALFWVADHFMQQRGASTTFAETAAPDKSVSRSRWARWRILNPKPMGNSSEESLIGTMLRSIPEFGGTDVYANLLPNAYRPASTIQAFLSLQEIFDSIEAGKGEYRDPASEGDREPEQAEQRLQRDLGKALELLGRSNENVWGKMTITYPPLGKPVRKSLTAMRPRPGFSGAFRYPLRAAIPVADGRAFGERRRVSGGTLLVDVSGSMCISADQIEAMVLERPALKVAIYSGGDDKGELRVIARNGHTVHNILPFWGNNVIDGPALRWLAQQKHPRIWVCDGHVTGVGDNWAPNLTKEAFQIQQRGGIIRFNDLIELGNSRYFKSRV